MAESLDSAPVIATEHSRWADSHRGDRHFFGVWPGNNSTSTTIGAKMKQERKQGTARAVGETTAVRQTGQICWRKDNAHGGSSQSSDVGPTVTTVPDDSRIASRFRSTVRAIRSLISKDVRH